jgi:hypothetical protein
MAGFKILRVTTLEPRSSWRIPAYGELWKTSEEAGVWLMGCPACGLPAFLEHDVKVLNGKATISPSVVCPEPSCRAHYWVVNGEVQPE